MQSQRTQYPAVVLQGPVSSMASSILSSIESVFHSFSMFSCQSSSNPSNSAAVGHHFLDPAMEFESDLSLRLDSLKQSAKIDLTWLEEALSIVLQTHGVVMRGIAEMKVPMDEQVQRAVNDYLDDGVKLLDACNVLRESFSDVQRYRMMVLAALRPFTDVRYAIQSEQKVSRSKHALEECISAIKKKEAEAGNKRTKLDNCSSMLRRMGEKLNTNADEDSSMNNGLVMSAMYGAKTVTIFVSGVLSMALLVKPKRILPTLQLTRQPLWAIAMQKLENRIKEEIDKRKTVKGSSIILQELDNVHMEVKHLYQKLNHVGGAPKESEMKDCVSRLQEATEELERKMLPVKNQVDEIYRTLVSTRVALLGVISHQPRN